MNLVECQRQLDQALLAFRPLWHPQPFRELRPGWCDALPALHDELMALPEASVIHFNDDGAQALALVARHLPDVAGLAALGELPRRAPQPLPALVAHGERWAWEIPGRKRQQIEAFAGVIAPRGDRVLDWCGGKGHLGRLLALAWGRPVESLEINPMLCAHGRQLAQRAGVAHGFIEADALATTDWPRAGQHAVALHACGDLHRQLIRRGIEAGVSRFDIAPCCYYRGVGETYATFSDSLALRLSRDDARLAVTETVTAAPREARQHDREMAWKLGFDAWRREAGMTAYRNFKPVPETWMRDSFAGFMARMCAREGIEPMPEAVAAHWEQTGWQRRDQVMRLSVVRHAFRRALEVWLVLVLAVHLESRGYRVDVGQFCERALTPRNLLISARRD